MSARALEIRTRLGPFGWTASCADLELGGKATTSTQFSGSRQAACALLELVGRQRWNLKKVRRGLYVAVPR